MNSPSATTRSRVFHSKYLPWVILGAILLVAIFFRFWRLNSLPPGLHPDEAANGLDIFRMFDHHDFRILYDTNGPREALFFYLQAIFVGLMGNTVLALRMAPAIIGVAAVAVTYLWSRDWFGRRVGLLSAAIFAINVWAITVTRDGFRASLTPLMVALVMWLGGRAYKTGRWTYFILAAITLGIGFYSYTAFDLLAGALVLGGIYISIARPKWVKQHLAKLALSAAIFAAIVSPLLYFTVRHPGESTLARANGTSFLNAGNNNGQPLQTLLSSTGRTLMQFNWRGDDNARHNTPGEPMLDSFVGVMFLIGLVVAIVHLNRPKYFMLLAVFGAMLLSAIVTAEGVPHGLRTIGAAPAAFILAALGINYILIGWYKTFPINRPARFVGLYLILLLLALSLIKSYKQYFVAWAQDPATYKAYAEDMVGAGKYLIAHNRNGQTNYVFAGRYGNITVEYLTHHKVNYTLVNQKQLENVPLGGHKLFIITTEGNANQALQTVRAKFPNGTLTEDDSSFNGQRLFYVYEVKS